MPRHDGRDANQLREVSIEPTAHSAAAAGVLVRFGRTTVLCSASVAEDVPPWMAGKGCGWVTAEYNMLPGSTTPRKPRERGKPDGRSTEIQRLIGRSLRAGVDFESLGERTVTVDCDVLVADGGTRTASITGGWVALARALRGVADGALRQAIAAVSVGVVAGDAALDLDYREDSSAAVDMNVVGAAGGRLVEVQGGGEGATFTPTQLAELVELAMPGLTRLEETQAIAIGR
ncbi:MAG: ribonuclease PH [Planctomycetota bacterium]